MTPCDSLKPNANSFFIRMHSHFSLHYFAVRNLILIIFNHYDFSVCSLLLKMCVAKSKIDCMYPMQCVFVFIDFS